MITGSQYEDYLSHLLDLLEHELEFAKTRTLMAMAIGADDMLPHSRGYEDFLNGLIADTKVLRTNYLRVRRDLEEGAA